MDEDLALTPYLLERPVMAEMTIYGQNLRLSLLAVLDASAEPCGDFYPSFRFRRPLHAGEVIATYYLEPGRRNRLQAEQVYRGLINFHASRPEPFAVEYLGGMKFLVAEILSEPVREPAKLVKSRLHLIELYCEM